MKKEPYGVTMQRPTISHEGDSRDSDRDESAAETSFLNRKSKEVFPPEPYRQGDCGIGLSCVVTVQYPARTILSKKQMNRVEKKRNDAVR